MRNEYKGFTFEILKLLDVPSCGYMGRVIDDGDKILYKTGLCDTRSIAIIKSEDWINSRLKEEDNQMEYIETESSNIKKVGYDAENSILEIWFHSGGKYWYFEFSEEYFNYMKDIIQSGDSIGKHFHKEIKSKHPYLNITHFEQDVEFDAIIIHNRDKMGTERNYLRFSQLCERHGWDFSDAWDKALGRTQWFDLQPVEYRTRVFAKVGEILY